MVYTIEELRHIIAPVASRHGVESVHLFGSYSTGKATDQSDVDLLISKGKIHTLFELSSFRLALEDALQLPVDMVTTTSQDREFLQSIKDDEVLLYRTA